MTDFHAHVLPKADHGCKNVEMSLAQLAQAREVGIHRIVATPHFYAQRHTVEEFLLRREYAYQTLEKENTTGVNTVVSAYELYYKIYFTFFRRKLNSVRKQIEENLIKS